MSGNESKPPQASSSPSGEAPSSTPSWLTTAKETLSALPAQWQKSRQQFEEWRHQTRQTVRAGIHSAVEAANQGLAAAEGAVARVRGPLERGQQSVAVVWHQGQLAYQRRHEYGPYGVAGTALIVGGLLARRRGRVVGALAGLTSGAVAYWLVYDDPRPYLEQVPDILFGTKSSSSSSSSTAGDSSSDKDQ